MAQTLNKLSARAVQTISDKGRHSDGGGLYLVVGPTGQKSWAFMYKVAGRRREMGLGALIDVPLAKARERAAAARELLGDGKDPLAERDKAKAGAAAASDRVTFGQAADDYIEARKNGWRGAKTLQGWRRSLDIHAAALRPLPVDAITSDDVVAALTPIWLTIPDSAGDARERIEKVLDAARARKLILGPWENPARWRGSLEHLMPERPRLTRGHQRAIPYGDIPRFMARLRDQTSMSARALEFTILTAVREGMTLFAAWSEISGEVWTIPAGRMKEPENGDHRVPLAPRAVDILRELRPPRLEDPDEVIFMNSRQTGAMSNAAMDAVLKRMNVDATPHGFRSTFRDWAGDCTDFPREVAEAALAHAVGDQKERAYRRGDAFNKRKALMLAWAKFCAGEG